VNTKGTEGNVALREAGVRAPHLLDDQAVGQVVRAHAAVRLQECRLPTARP
jgi:hypothetical protein